MKVPEPFANFDPFFRYVAKPQTRREKAFERFKHLPGRHDQRKHGADTGGGGGGGTTSNATGTVKVDEYRKTIRTIIDEADSATEARFEASKLVSKMDETSQMELLNDPKVDGVTFTALSTFGTPAVRELAAKKYWDATQGKMYYGDEETPEPYSTFNANGEKIDSTYQYMHRHSLEFAEIRRSDNNIDDQSTAEFLWGMHASDGNGFATAQIQMALSQVGPNADIPKSLIRSFYPEGITPPEPNPRYVSALQQTYDKTQAELAAQGITHIKLYRGSPYAPGLALEPWTPQKKVASEFAKNYSKKPGNGKVVVRTASIPAKYFLATWQTAEGWDEDAVRGKEEHMVAGLAYAHDTGDLR